MIRSIKYIFISIFLFFFVAIVNIENAKTVEYDSMALCVNDLIVRGQKFVEDDRYTVLQKKQMLIDVFTVYFLFDWNAKMALGRPFQSLTDAEKKTYITEYSKYFSYTWFPELFYDKRNGIKINIRPTSEVINEKDSIVNVDVISPDGKKYELALRVRKNDKKDMPCNILNLTLEGIDLAMSYRSQFASYIEANNNRANSIIGYLKEKNDKLKKTSGLTVPFK